jgi:hypothetical protein
LEIAKKLGGLFGSASKSPPPRQLPIGFAMPWQPKMGGDGKLTAYSSYTDPGIAIGFQNEALSESQGYIFYGDGESVRVFYEIPAKAGDPIVQASEFLAKSDDFFTQSDLYNRLTQGYLNYVAEALNLIYLTDNGGKLINGLIATKRSILIVVQASHLGNAYSGGGALTCVSSAYQLIDRLRKNALDANLLLELMKSTSGLSAPLAASNWIADKVNKLPLYSLFVQAPEYADGGGFLAQFLRFRGAAVTGQVILEWLTNVDGGAFLNFLLTDKTTRDEVVLVDYFRSALIMILYGRSVPGASADTTVQLNVTFNPKDDNDPAKERPPAIGLGHELVHAYNVACGAQPGMPIHDFSTMLAERLCVGLAPFADVAISENNLRTDWPTVAARASVPFDQRPPGPRLVYDVVPAEEVQATRKRARTP